MMRRMYIHQHQDWPDFRWDQLKLAGLLAAVRFRQGRLIGHMQALGFMKHRKRSHSRNPLIFGLFARMHLVEQVGSGVGRIKDLMKEEGLPDPVFQSTQKTTQKTEERILEILKNNPQASRSEIAASLGDITENGVKYQLNSLRRKGKIERIGPDKGGYWKILNS